jgi:hypothetical protein
LNRIEMNNPPAFPCGEYTSTGMTLRDYFAAQAMGGVISATEALMKIDEPHLAMWSYRMADAMLKAREA